MLMLTIEDALDILYTKVMSTSEELLLRDCDKWDPMLVMSKWCEALSLPLTTLKVIHIAGTKGKGSTAAFTESILRHHGLRIGLYTSPHLIDIRERFRVNGEIVCEKDFLLAFTTVWERVKELTSVLPPPGFFRFLTLIAFYLFTSISPVDVLILEVGVGGRLDATNVIPSPVVCGITLIDLDHTEVLGDTLEAIAWEKGGIIKEGVRDVYVAPQVDSVIKVFRSIADERHVSFHVARDFTSWPCTHSPTLGLAGSFQYDNASLAMVLCHSFLLKSTTSHEEGILYGGLLSEVTVNGLKNTQWAGRCQVIDLSSHDRQVKLYLDGAHTPKSMDAVVKWFNEEVKEDKGKRVLVFHCGQERKAGVLMSKLLPLHFDVVIFVPPSMFRPSKHSLPTVSDLLLDVDPSLVSTHEDDVGGGRLAWSRILDHTWRCLAGSDVSIDSVFVMDNMKEVIDWISSVEEKKVDLLVTGSLYIIGDILKATNTRV